MASVNVSIIGFDPSSVYTFSGADTVTGAWTVAPAAGSNTIALTISGTDTGGGTGFQALFIDQTGGAGTLLPIVATAYGTGMANRIRFRTANGTKASPSATQNGDELGAIVGTGYGTSFPADKAAIILSANQTWTATANGTSLSFQLTPNGSTTRAEVIGATSTLITFKDTLDIAVGSTVGTKIGTAITQLLGFYNATPIVQRAGAAQAAVATTGSTQTTPYGYTTSAQADAIVTLVNELRAWAVAQGFIKGAA